MGGIKIVHSVFNRVVQVSLIEKVMSERHKDEGLVAAVHLGCEEMQRRQPGKEPQPGYARTGEAAKGQCGRRQPARAAGTAQRGGDSWGWGSWALTSSSDIYFSRTGF